MGSMLQWAQSDPGTERPSDRTVTHTLASAAVLSGLDSACAILIIKTDSSGLSEFDLQWDKA